MNWGAGSAAASAAAELDGPAPADDAAYLRRVGDRVRAARTRRGMTRKALARESGVSERYLAQLEGGAGNVSILLLRQIARALGEPLADFARDGSDPPAEMALLADLLARLPGPDVAAAHRLLIERFGAAPAADRRRRVALIGLRGAGKSTLGRALAEATGARFVELDREIERDAQTSVAEIFALYGQAAYRRYERRRLEAVIADGDAVVIETGGGIVAEPETFNLLLAACVTVWVQASPEEHMARVVAQGDLRPMADNHEAMDDLRRILAGRAALYGRADLRLDTSGRDPAACLAELRTALRPLIAPQSAK